MSLLQMLHRRHARKRDRLVPVRVEYPGRDRACHNERASGDQEFVFHKRNRQPYIGSFERSSRVGAVAVVLRLPAWLRSMPVMGMR